jgi:hypothetical protein
MKIITYFSTDITSPRSPHLLVSLRWHSGEALRGHVILTAVLSVKQVPVAPPVPIRSNVIKKITLFLLDPGLLWQKLHLTRRGLFH